MRLIDASAQQHASVSDIKKKTAIKGKRKVTFGVIFANATNKKFVQQS